MNDNRTSPAAPRLAGLGLAVPGRPWSQQETRAFLLAHYQDQLSSRNRAFLRRVFTNAAIRTRYFAFADPTILLTETPDQRIARFQSQAVSLAAQAGRRALDRAGLAAAELTGLVVNTCTGYLCPGLTSYLIEEMDLRRDIRAYDLVGSGCGGALPNLQLAAPLVRESGGPVLSVAVEICSATFQMADELSLLLSNALFSDGAAAAVIGEQPAGWRLVASASHHFPELREYIRYVHRDGQLHNQLSLELPELIGAAIPPMIKDFLDRQALTAAAIEHWAIHVGGARIIDILQEKLDLSAAQLQPTRQTLADYGNISSPTVMFVLDNITARGVPAGERCLLLAFGAGLSAHALLLEMT